MIDVPVHRKCSTEYHCRPDSRFGENCGSGLEVVAEYVSVVENLSKKCYILKENYADEGK